MLVKLFIIKVCSDTGIYSAPSFGHITFHDSLCEASEITCISRSPYNSAFLFKSVKVRCYRREIALNIEY